MFALRTWLSHALLNPIVHRVVIWRKERFAMPLPKKTCGLRCVCFTLCEHMTDLKLI